MVPVVEVNGSITRRTAAEPRTATAEQPDRFGGAARGDSLANRQSSARNQIGRQGGNLASARPSNRSAADLQAAAMHPASSGNRGGSGFGNSSGVGNRAWSQRQQSLKRPRQQ